MTFQQTIKQEAERVDSLEPQKLKKVPNFYQGFSNSPYTSRFQNQEVNENFPFIVEYLEGSVTLNAQGKNIDTITFTKQVHIVPPIVEGMLYQPDLPSANVLPIQTYLHYTSSDGADDTLPMFSGIGYISTNGFVFNINTKYEDYYDVIPNTHTYTYPYANQTVKYKLWVLRLAL